MARKLVSDSRSGSSKAQRLLLGYLIGKPRVAQQTSCKIEGLPDVSSPGGPRAFVGELVQRVARGEVAVEFAAALVSLLRVGAANGEPDVTFDMRGASVEAIDFSYL